MKSAIERYAFLVSCEHGGNAIPANYRKYFAGESALLQSHRAYDPGALSMARGIARQLGSPLIYSTISRLLVDVKAVTLHRFQVRYISNVWKAVVVLDV